MKSTSPETTVRGFSSPTSTFSTYSFSASGWRSAEMISPTRTADGARADDADRV
jgi:hypothetical protein